MGFIQDSSFHVVQVNTYDIRGGAAIAVHRLYAGLKLFNPNVRMLVKFKKSTNPDIITVVSSDVTLERKKIFLSDVIHEECIVKNRTAMSNTVFSYPLVGYDFEHSIVLTNADIINLHWIHNFCSLSSLKKIIGLKKPIVWTLHDQWLFTGGCHYTSGCDKYLEECMHCPQLLNDEKHLPHYFLDKKRELIKEMNPVIVTPSTWLAQVIQGAPVFQNLRVEVIPNSIDTTLYVNTPKNVARKRLNLQIDGFYLLFNVTNASEKRKGIERLIGALQYCMEDPTFFNKVRKGEIQLICFGDPGIWFNEVQIPFISLGKIKNESDLSTVYSAANLFLVPSIEDNLPNVVIEAMSCGTPTIAFNVGGMPDMIQNGVNGYIVENGSETAYAKIILDLINTPEHCEELSKNCRTIALNAFSLEVQAKKYMELYHTLLMTKSLTTDTLVRSPIHYETELLPDASDIETDEKIFEIVTEIAGKFLVLQTIKLQLNKIKRNIYYRFRQIFFKNES